MIRSHFRYKKVLLTFVIILLVGLGACKSKTVDEVTIGTISWPGYSLLTLAEQKGFFKEFGVSVKVKIYPNIDQLHKDYLAGSIHGLTGTLSEFLLIRENSKRRPQVFLIADFSDGPDVIVAKTDFEDVKALKGQRVAVDLKSLGSYVLTRGLERAGLDLGDVRLADMPMEKMEVAIASPKEEGGVAAIVAYPPVSTDVLQNKAHHVVFSSAEIPGEVVDAIAMESWVIEHNREFVENLTRGFNKAVEYYRDSTKEATKELAAIEKLSIEDFNGIMTGLKILTVCEQKPFFVPSGTLPEAIKTSDLILRRVNLLTGTDSTVGMITFGPVQVVGKDCVN